MSPDLICHFVLVQDLAVGDLTSAGRVASIRHTAKRVYFTTEGSDYVTYQAKGSRLAVFTPAAPDA